VIVNRAFGPQDRPGFVIGPDGVGVRLVFDPGSFRSIPVAAGHFFVAARTGFTEEYVCRIGRSYAMMIADGHVPGIRSAGQWRPEPSSPAAGRRFRSVGGSDAKCSARCTAGPGRWVRKLLASQMQYTHFTDRWFSTGRR